MKTKPLTITLVVLIALMGFLYFFGPFYEIKEGQQAVITQFGSIVATDQTAGLKLKIPFIQDVTIYPNKIMSWDGEPQLIPTLENQFIWVDTTARWRITDPRRFYEAVKFLPRGYSRLDDIIDPAVRQVISTNPLIEAVRSTNVINQTQHSTAVMDANGEEIQGLNSLISTNTTYNPIKVGRSQLCLEILKSVKDNIYNQFGITVIDVLIRQIRYSDQLTQSVYNRMISEREQIAAAYRSYGQGKKQEILGKMDRERKTILSAAYAKAEEIKGRADAKAAKIYASAYNADPSFYEFWKSMESYQKTLPQFPKTLTTNMDYFKFLYSPHG
ncbi:MAG: protease modulator HflC [Spirochaetales bacterium]|nr:protease modulator HflC [Spirochaetales bacterium]